MKHREAVWQGVSTLAPAAQGPPAAGTAFDLTAMRLSREHLSTQINQLTLHRRELMQQRVVLSREEGRGHDVRIAAIDERLGRLEAELMQADDVMSSVLTSDAAAAAAGSGANWLGDLLSGQSTTLDDRLARAVHDSAENAVYQSMGAGALAMLAAVVLWQGARRFLLKRSPSRVFGGAQAAELQRSIDVVAIEVERIAEAQRFMAKRFDDFAPAIGAAAVQGSRRGEAAGVSAHK